MCTLASVYIRRVWCAFSSLINMRRVAPMQYADSHRRKHAEDSESLVIRQHQRAAVVRHREERDFGDSVFILVRAGIHFKTRTITLTRLRMSNISEYARRVE